MRGGLERWKRGAGSDGVRQAVAYALQGSCDATRGHAPRGIEEAVAYSDVHAGGATRFTVTPAGIAGDVLDHAALARWVDGADPLTGEPRGRVLTSPDADLLLDATMNMPKSFSLAVLLSPDLRGEFEALQDRIRDRTLTLWQRELNARRGAGGLVREPIARLEVVELRHERSRALDPHIHRHLWLGIKVLGVDGKWSNVDSRVAMKLHTVVNAEGDLASRSDPVWVAALAARGYTLNTDGEIAELAHLVRPLSRRSNQIEANRAVRLAAWRRDHPGQHPDHTVLAGIDRWAWAQHRPDKPDVLDEDAWRELILSEIASLDPNVASSRFSADVVGVPVGEVDRDLLAAMAVADADRRSAGTGGRFSRYDIRAGALRALAASGIVTDRERLDELVEDVAARAVEEMVVDFLDGDEGVPAHVKHLMSFPTAQAKVDLATRFDHLTTPGRPIPAETIVRLADRTLPAGRTLDRGQAEAAGAIGGTDRLVTITGPAGTGKTTLLRVARTALQRQGRGMVVVAPTRKAATVAGREIGTTASSLHALLVDHGYRFHDDPAGRTVWTRVRVGDTDPVTGAVYRSPTRYPLRSGDRVVVDEAGMVDLHTALALAELVEQTGAGIAMIGDHLQALPVGHSGAMATMQRRSNAVVELTAVHRFRDPDYAALTLRLRNPADHADAVDVARRLAAGGHLETVQTEGEARERMVHAWLEHARRGERIALVTATNAEAQQVNDRIQQERLNAGHLTATRHAVAQDGQPLLEGDLIQTRRNDTSAGVDNRATWTITRIHDDSIELASVADSGDRRTISREYAAEHVHLAYASTVHGIQGDTVHTSYVGPGVDAAGLYVGMTRGRHHNTTLTIARNPAEAIDRVADTMMRGRIEVTLDDARHAAQHELGRAARDPEHHVDPSGWEAEIAHAEEHRRELRAALRYATIDAVTLEARQHGRSRRVGASDSGTPRVDGLARELEVADARFAALVSRRHSLPTTPVDSSAGDGISAGWGASAVDPAGSNLGR